MQMINVVCSYTAGVPAALPPALVPQIKSYLSANDIPLLSQALSLLALLLELAPTTTFPEIESDLLPDVYRIAYSPLVSGAALDSLLSFCAALVNADNQIVTHLVPAFRANAGLHVILSIAGRLGRMAMGYCKSIA
jgi:cullin-associated NEDD8-dissociated protein 1